ncbi:hypothetical protein, partial [uncultured Arthrobacter sp.]|uniref:hypothetical protein n=1 Tax=uncultured Arthrobacter sp. TaxID=114050 RepID=UPI0032163AAA
METTEPGAPPAARIATIMVNAMDAEDFPNIAVVAGGVSVELDPKLLRTAIERVEFAAASDDSRPVLT